MATPRRTRLSSTRRWPSSAGFGVTIDEAVGGSGGGMVDACIFMEETSRGLAPIGGYGATLIVAGAVKRFGSDEQKQNVLGGPALTSAL